MDSRSPISSPSPRARGKFNRKEWLCLALIVMATFVSFSPILNNQFTNWDDLRFIVQNPEVRDFGWESLKKAFTKMYVNVYVPLTVASWMIEHRFVGFEPFWYFFDNLLLHSAVSALVFVLGLRLGLPLAASFLGALLFGVHPVHVESVAWATERKDVLFGFFYMLALLQYWSYLHKGGKRHYILSILFGILSILSKVTALSLPLALFALDYYQKRRIDRTMFLDKIPHFLYVVPIASITFLVHSDLSTLHLPGETLKEAVPIFFFTFSFYLQKFLWPALLVPYYQLPQPISMGQAPYLVAAAVFFAYAVLLLRFRRNRLFIFSAAFFLGSIFFMVRFGTFIRYTSVVADRFIYIPSVGLCIFSGKFLFDRLKALEARSRAFKRLGIVIVGVLFVLLAAKTFTQCRIWKDSVSHWSYAIEKNPPYRGRALVFRAHAYALLEDWERALQDCNAAIQLDPRAGDAYAQRGAIYAKLGYSELAMEDLNKAFEREFIKPSGLVNRANLYIEKGMLEAAIVDAQEALKRVDVFDEGEAKAYAVRGKAYGLMGELEKAIDDLSRSIALDPSDPLVYYDRGFFLSQAGQWEKAIDDYSSTLAIDPMDVFTLDQRGSAYFSTEKFDLALDDFNKALALNNRYSRSYNNRGSVYLAKGDWKAALSDFNKAISLDEEYALAYLNRSKAYQRSGEKSLALADALKARELGADVEETYINELKAE